jgi:hypothetical protein
VTQKLTAIIQEAGVSRETAVSSIKSKRLSCAAYRKRSLKGWITRKRQKQAREAVRQEEAGKVGEAA